MYNPSNTLSYLFPPPADTHSFLLPFSVGKLTTALWTEPHPQPSTWVQRVQCMPHGNAEIPFYCTHSFFKQKIIMHACHMVMQTYDSIAFTLFLNANKSKQNKKGHQNKPKLSLTQKPDKNKEFLSQLRCYKVVYCCHCQNMSEKLLPQFCIYTEVMLLSQILVK